jgi:hypothetical protein
MILGIRRHHACQANVVALISEHTPDLGHFPTNIPGRSDTVYVAAVALVNAAHDTSHKPRKERRKMQDQQLHAWLIRFQIANVTVAQIRACMV